MANVIQDADNSVTIYESAARTVTPDTQEFNLRPGTQYGLFVIDVTAATSTPSTVFKVEGVDKLSGKVWTVLQSAALVGAGTTFLKVGPVYTTSGTVTVQDVIPPVIRITATHGNANSQTYSMSGHFS